MGIEMFYVPVLAKAKLLRPVGRPAANGRKFFCRERVVELSRDEAWLAKVAAEIVRYNASRNHGGKSGEAEAPDQKERM